MQIRNKQGEKIDHIIHHVDGVDDKLLILAHGLTGDMDHEMIVALSVTLAKMGWPTIRISFSGCGNSEGKFTESTISKESDDLIAVLDQVKGTKKIALIGYSMGAATGALTIAKDDRISVMVSLAGMVQTHKFAKKEFGNTPLDKGYMWDDESFLLTKTFMKDLKEIDTVIPAIKDIRIPWLLVHGSIDEAISPDDSLLLFNHLKGKKKHVIINGADHSFTNYWDEIAIHINDWLNMHL